MKLKYLIVLIIGLSANLFYSQSLTSSLTACYALNGNASEPINNFTGTLSAVTPTLDRFNNPNSAFAFSGNAGSFIELPDNPLLKPTNAISFSCWVRMNTLAVGQYIIFNKNTVFSNFEAYTINVATQFGAPKFRVQKGAGGLTTIVDGTTTALINTWYHIAGTIDNSSVNLYVNGVLENSLPTALPFSYVPGKRVILGGSNEPSFNLPFNGSIDNVRFYNRMLTPAEVNQLYLTDPACIASISNPNCNSSFYAQTTSGVFESGLTIPNTSTLIALPPTSSGFAVGPAFGFPAPNPTFWTTIGGNFAYYDGTNFINTGHSTSNAGAVNIGGSKNLIYNLVGATGQVYKYNGTGAATLVATIPALAGGGPYDLVGDDQDNFYYLRTQPPQSLNVYDPTGILTCSYSITGVLPATAGGGFSIVGNTVTAHTGSAYYVGIIAGSVVNFTTTPSSFASPSDFANCHLVNTFSSNITGNPSASLTCSTPTLTLTASSTLSPNTYTWTGPGILTPINNQTVQVNVAGVYTCSLTSLTGCPTKTSVATFTVINSVGILTPTISSTGSLSCTNPTTQLIVSPNSPTNTILWTGPGIVGANNTATIIANAAGIYSVTLTSTLCSGTATFNLASGIAPLTLVPNPSSAQICSSSGPVTLSVTGATNYTWAPAASLVPSTGSVVAANPGSTTTYTINGVTGVCSGSAMVTVSVNATPTVVITSGIQTICAGNTATLSASGATSYTWNPGGLIGSPVVVSPGVTTIYTVIGANGSCTASATTSVVVVPSPTIFTLASPASVCQGVSTSILAAGALSYTWQPGNLNGALVTVTPAISTVYTVSGTNAAGCIGTSTVLITVDPNPTITINPASPTICAGSSATLTAAGAVNYTWTPGAVVSSSLVVTPASSTSYTVNGDDGTCPGSSTVLVTVVSNPTVTPSASSTLICLGGSTTLSAIGAGSYTWNPGNLSGSSVTVSPVATTVYTVTGGTGICSDTKTISITVNNGPTVTVVSSPTTICSTSGSSATLTASGALSYTWNPGAVVASSLIITPTVTSTFSVSGINGLGCVSTTTLSYSVTPTPTINTSSSSPAICAGSSVTLSATGATSYTWNPGALPGGTVTASPAISTTYTVTGSNGNCTSTATIAIIVNANPTITASSSPTVICSGSSSTLTAGGALTFTWMPGALIGTIVSVSPGTTTNYTVTGTNASGCTATAVTSVSVNITPTLNPVATPTAICIGGSSTLSSTGATSYTWNPGNLSGNSITVAPVSTTVYTVTGITLNCSDTKTLSVIVNPLPIIGASSSPTAICIGGTSTLTGSGGSTYTWSPGLLVGTNVTVSPVVNTTYTVTGTNSNGCVNTATTNVSINPNPTVTASSSPTVICSGSSSTLTAGGAVSYTWNPGAMVTQTINVTPPVTTNYTVIGTNAFGCTASAITIVSVNITPSLNPIATPSAICIGGTSTLSSTGASSYTWNPGNLSGSSVTVAPLVTTAYTLVGSTSGCFDTKTVSVIVNPLPVIGGSSSPTAICVGNSATLSGSGGATYTWVPGPLTGVSVTVSPLVNTAYTVVGTSSLGCSNSGTVSLVVNANPTITAISNPTSICSGSGTSATLTAGGAVSYTWMPGALPGSSVVVTPTATTIYTVSGTNASGCVSTGTVSILITPSPTITINGNPAPLCRGSSSTLTASGAASYTWLPGGSTATSIVVSPTATTVYTVIGASGNCSSTKTFTLVVLPRPNINITTIPPVICSGGSALLLAFGASSYTWNPGSSVGNTLVVSPSVTTSYTVTGSNLAGCTNTAVTTVSVNPSPTISTVPSATFACSGSSVTLVSSGGVTYLVNPGALTGPIVVVSPSVTTTYTISGINNFGCTDTETVTIAVGTNPSITASASGSLLCDGGAFTLTASGATNYTWMPIALSGSNVVTTATNSINTYTVVGEDGGCSSIATVSVFVISCNNTMFGMTKAAGKPVLVYNSFYNVDFTVTAVNASTINLTNVTLNEDLGFAFPMPSNFSVVSQPVITSQNSSLTINPLFDGVSQISLTSPSTSTLLANKRDTIVFTVRIDPKGFYGPFNNWVIGYANFINNVTVMDTSNNGFTWDPDLDGDPTNNDTVTIINLPPIDLFIPDGFSPDGDGKNDFFFIKGLNGRPVKLTIFNRWGNKVYEKSEYDNSWDGLVNATGLVLGSNKVPAATYYYIIEFLDREKETRTGFVVVQY